MRPSTDPREAALRWHWGQLFLQILMWLNLEERWDGISSVRKIWSQKRWLSVLMGLTQYFNQLTLSSYPRCPKHPDNIWRSFFISPAFPLFSLVLLCPVSLYVSFFSRPSLCFHLVVVSIHCLLTISVSLCLVPSFGVSTRYLWRQMRPQGYMMSIFQQKSICHHVTRTDPPLKWGERWRQTTGKRWECPYLKGQNNLIKSCLWVIASKSHQQIGQWDSFKSDTIVNVFQMSVIILCWRGNICIENSTDAIQTKYSYKPINFPCYIDAIHFWQCLIYSSWYEHQEMIESTVTS